MWLTPENSTDTLEYFYVRRIQDADTLQNTSDVPFRFLPCMVAGLSYYLSIKRAPERTQLLKSVYEEEFQRAAAEDEDKVALTLTPDIKYLVSDGTICYEQKLLWYIRQIWVSLSFTRHEKEWNGLFVGKDEFEPKHPQIDLRVKTADAEAIKDARPDREEPSVSVILPHNPFKTGSGGSSPTTVTTEQVMEDLLQAQFVLEMCHLLMVYQVLLYKVHLALQFNLW